MGYLVLATTLLWIAASAVSCYPGRQREAQRLAAFAGFFTAVSAVAALLIRKGMFSDAAAVPAQLWIRAACAIGVCLLLGVGLAYIAGRKNRRG